MDSVKDSDKAMSREFYANLEVAHELVAQIRLPSGRKADLFHVRGAYFSDMQ